MINSLGGIPRGRLTCKIERFVNFEVTVYFHYSFNSVVNSSEKIYISLITKEFDHFYLLHFFSFLDMLFISFNYCFIY
jgi:hypothetical protein